MLNNDLYGYAVPRADRVGNHCPAWPVQAAMMIHGRASRGGTQGMLGLLAIGTLLGLAACGSAVATGSGHRAAAGQATARSAARASAGVPLCAAARQMDQLEIRLTASQPREILPRALTTTDAARVRALATALCALPPLRRGLRCPAAPRGALLLVFAAPGHGFSTVRIQDAGCPNVAGIGPAREWSWSSPPGQLLSRTVGGTGRLVPTTHPSSVPMR